MDNNNNRRSPLDEIRRVTHEATNNAERAKRTAASAQNNAPTVNGAAPQRRPVQTPGNAQSARPAPQHGRPAAQVQNPATAKGPAEPAQNQVKRNVSVSGNVNQTETRTARTVQRPGAAAGIPTNTSPEPQKEDFGIDIPDFSRTPSPESLSPENIAMSRAAKVRMARQSAMRAKEDASRTRVVDLSDLTPEQKAELDRQREEARKLVESNTTKFDNFKTRITDTVPSVAPAQRRTATMAQRNRRAPKKSASQMTEEFEETIGKGVLSNTVKAIIYIVSVLVISACLSLFAIFVGNDCFAFVKNSTDVVVTIPEDADLGDIASILHDNGIIKYPNMFKLYINMRNKDTNDYVAGDYTVNGMMSYDTLIKEFMSASTRKEATITIVEGSTTQEIIDLFIENGIGTQEGFEAAINDSDYDFWFVNQLTDSMTKGRKFRLDGYLFPDTYNFYTDAKEEDVIYKLLSNFNTKFSEENEARCQELGMSVDDIVILASMIQKEAKYVSDYPLVSSVFYNRLNSTVTNGKLESNATVQYTMPADEVGLKLTNDQINKYDNAYNTFLYEGLPVGPICNSSLNALNWAMYPNDTDYYYFVSDAEGYNLYASSYQQHLANVAAIEAEG